MTLFWTQLASLLGPPGQIGPPGPQGAGVPAGGSTGQLLRKRSAADHDSEWAQAPAADPLFIQASPPSAEQLAGASRYQWWDTSGGTLTLYIEDGGELMALRNAFDELALESTLQALRLAVAALTRTIGLMTPDAAGRMRVSLDAAPATVAATQSGTWTLTNQSQVGGYGANDQIPALMHLSADSLRRNITVS